MALPPRSPCAFLGNVSWNVLGSQHASLADQRRQATRVDRLALTGKPSGSRVREGVAQGTQERQLDQVVSDQIQAAVNQHRPWDQLRPGRFDSWRHYPQFTFQIAGVPSGP